MSNAKSLSDDQIAAIRSWANDGAQLSDIQGRLSEEMEMKVTYLETRFLLEDLKIEIKAEAKPEPEPEVEETTEPEPESREEAPGAAAPEAKDSEDADLPDEPVPDSPEGEANVSVTIDKVLRPGALVSGRVDFGGGKTAAWWLDQMGRLGMDSDDPEFRPSEAQAMAFQQQLQAAIQESGL